jgi:hypothetical protein
MMMTNVDSHRNRVEKTGNLLKILIGLTLLALLAQLVIYGLLHQFSSDAVSGNFKSRADLIASGRMLYHLTIAEAIIRIVVELALAVTLMVWVYRSDALARVLGSTEMAHKPAGSVAWFFVPLANVIKPYFVMKEIYLGTVRPKTYDLKRDEPPGLGILRVWWLIWVGDKVFQATTSLFTSRGTGLQAALDKTHILAASTVLSILATGLLLLVVKEFARVQQFADPVAPRFGHVVAQGA